MNELWINLGYGFLYIDTSSTTLPDALGEFLYKLDYVGLNYDNFGWQEIELRDENGNTIEYFGTGSPADLGC